MDERTLPDDPRDWPAAPRPRWAESLRAAPDATAEVAAAAFLRSLPGDEFAPPVERVAAANALAGTAAPVGRDEAVEALLRAEVEAFAGRFWSLELAERRAAWADLSRRGAAPGRLRELEPGLDVVAPALSDPAAEELAALVRELFVLAPRPRAIRRNAWLLEHAAEADTWRAAHATLQKEAPALAALEPRLQRVLEVGFRTALAAFAEGASTSPIGQSAAAGVADFTHRMREYERTGEFPAPTLAERAERAYRKFISVLTTGFVLLLAFGCIVGRRTREESAIPRSANPVPISASPRDSAPGGRTFTPAEVATFQRYEAQRLLEPGTVTPGGYADWVRAGRPAGTQSTVYLNAETIAACQLYERRLRDTRPALHLAWVAAGKPTKPGIYSYSATP